MVDTKGLSDILINANSTKTLNSTDPKVTELQNKNETTNNTIIHLDNRKIIENIFEIVLKGAKQSEDMFRIVNRIDGNILSVQNSSSILIQKLTN
jgi:hypothetical protein